MSPQNGCCAVTGSYAARLAEKKRLTEKRADWSSLRGERRLLMGNHLSGPFAELVTGVELTTLIGEEGVDLASEQAIHRMIGNSRRELTRQLRLVNSRVVSLSGR